MVSFRGCFILGGRGYIYICVHIYIYAPMLRYDNLLIGLCMPGSSNAKLRFFLHLQDQDSAGLKIRIF